MFRPQNLFPFIFHYGDIYVPTFFFMIMVASLVCTYYIYWQAGKKKMSQIAILDIAMVATITGVIGARLFHVFVEAPDYYWEKPVRVFYFWQGGFVGYGAFLGVMSGALAYLKIRKMPLLRYADLVSLGCPLIIFFVRIGCLGAGCCYGKPTHFFIHLIFHNPSSEGGHFFRDIPLHATQIYDQLNALITFGIIHWVDKHKKFDGQVLLTFLMSYAFFRFWIEFLRGDVDRGVYFNGMISTSQITSLIFIVVGSILYSLLLKKSRSS